MRYGAMVSTADSGDFGPHHAFTDRQRRVFYRFPDEVYYSQAMYIYSLEPPPNPNRLDERAAQGKEIFAGQGCGGCHTAPLYTNNMLTVATGFTPPKEHFKMLDIMNVSVGTDPGAALKTRKGTGYYKVPSLKGVWYRGLYLHDGSVGSLGDVRSRPAGSESCSGRVHRIQGQPPGHSGPRVRLEAEAGRAGQPDRLSEDVVVTGNSTAPANRHPSQRCRYRATADVRK